MAKRKVIVIVLALIMAASLITVSVSAEETTDLSIGTLAELQAFADSAKNGETFEGQTVALTADIDLGGESNPWTPISTFKGTFDGNGHVVSGLYIASGSTVGFFGAVNGGTIKNLVVRGSVAGASNVAGVVGNLTAGQVINCGNEATVSGDTNVGGVVGVVNGASTVSGCYNKGDITATTGYIGGVTGQHWRAGTVQNCYNVGTVKGPATVGGVVGGHKAASPVVENCFNAGSVVDSTGNANNIGAVVGATRGTQTNCFYLTGCGTSTKEGVKEVAKITADMLGEAFIADDDGINGGLPVLAWQQKVPDLIIGSYEALKAFADSVNGGETYEGKLVRLDVNVTLGGESNPWTPISMFKGTFDGNYHVVSDLYIASGSTVGFFGAVNGGTIKNLVVRGSVAGASNVAGVVGNLTAGQVINCGNEATVSGDTNVGGVVGVVNGASTVSGCYNKGDITATTGYIGGVTGQHWRAGTVQNCYNVGTVKGPATVGGVVGGHKAASPVVENCFNAGSVVDSTGNANNIGAVVGATRGTQTNCFYLKGCGTSIKAGVTEVSAISAEQLGDAFVASEQSASLKWEASVSDEAPVRPAFVEKTERSAQLAGYIKDAIKSTKTNGSISGTLLGSSSFTSGASSTGTDWMALAMGRFGYYVGNEYVHMVDDGTGYEDYLAALKTYIETTYAANNGLLHRVKATEWHRAVVTIAALGGDPTNFGTYNGKPINLVADGSYNNALSEGPGTQGINGWIWGLIAMDVGMYEVPSDAKYTRDTFITEILKMQLTDGVNGNKYGGWVLGGYGTKSDVDITAMAIQALAPYYNSDKVYTYVNEISKQTVSKTVRQCVDEALDVLGSMQKDSGGFSSWSSENSESIAQAIVALCSVGINPATDSRFVTPSGKTLLDGLLQFALSDGGFCHVANTGWNSMANDQATYALISYWRLENGFRSLYDMRGEMTDETKQAIVEATNAITEAVNPSAENYKQGLKSALQKFRNVPEAERRYVVNYSVLASAIELVGGEEALDTTDPYVVSISVTKNPDKVRYYIGETFDTSGMEVSAVYSDGRTEVIQSYTVSPTGKLALGDDAVYIYYGILKTTVTIEVRERMPWQGEGTEDDPYLIETPDDLVDLRWYVFENRLNTVGVYFRMTQDVNMKNIADWKGIGDSSAKGFQGHFDGNGFKVWNLNGHTYNDCGLFGRLGDGAVIQNLTIASGTIGGEYNNSIGGIAGQIVENATVTIKNCHNYATLIGNWGIGGIVGQIENGASATFENCSNHGTINAAYTGGGIVGQVGPNRWKANGAKAAVINCYNVGTIQGNGTWGLGGLVGSYRLCGAGQVIRNSYNAGKVSNSETAGAIFGSIAESDLTIENVFYLDSSNNAVSGVFTDGGDDTVGTVTGNAIAKSQTEMCGADVLSLLGTAFLADKDNINDKYPVLNGQKALGTESAVRSKTEIYDATDLKAFADRVNAGESFTGKTVLLMLDIDLIDIANWVPIGRYSSVQFDGIFDGQGHVIKNLNSTSGGLFGYAGTNAVIKNLGIASGTIGKDNLSFVGAIVGWSNGADIINCWNGATIFGSYSGGIVGTVRDGGESVIQGCFNVGSVTDSFQGNVGGIVGHLATSNQGTNVNVTVSDCYNLGAITALDDCGGIVGRAQDGHVIKNCYNAGVVTANGENILFGAGAIASSVTSDNEITNCYYDSSKSTCGISNGTDNTVGKTAQEMNTAEFVALLGNGFQQDRYGIVNNGYPLCDWQDCSAANAVDFVVDKINAIGNVTVNSGSAIDAARKAYKDLEEELKSFVPNYSVLVAAESDYQAALLAQAKTNATAELENYKVASDYRQAQRTELQQIVDQGKQAIAAATTEQEVATALSAAKANADKVKTNAQLNAEEAQAVIDAISAIGNVTVNSGSAIQAARQSYDALSDEAKLLVENYSALVAAESDYQAALLAQAKTNATAELENYKVASDYRQAQRTELQQIVDQGKQAIAAATTEQEVATALSAAKANADKVKTNAQLNAEEAQAVVSIISAIGNVNSNSKQSIEEARQAYEALSDEAKRLVANYADLISAESTYTQIVKEQNRTATIIWVCSAAAVACVVAAVVVVMLKRKKAKAK